MNIKLNNKYHNMLLNHPQENEELFNDKDLSYLQSVGLEIIRHGIISIKGFSHSFLIDENPQLYRTIIFAVNDVLENIPDRHNFNNKQLLLQYINEFIAFSTNLEKVLVLVGLIHDARITSLIHLMGFGNDLLNINKN